jgi:cysteine desulfuration protein SufE
MESIPPRLNQIIEDFQISEGREKLELLLEFSESLAPLPDWLIGHPDQMDQVHECMTPVFIQAQLVDGKMVYYFDVPAESPTVRGFAAMLKQGVEGTTPQEILAIPNDFHLRMGLEQVLTQQRLNGISAILAYMKRLAIQMMS